MRILLIIMLLVCTRNLAQDVAPTANDSLSSKLFEKGNKKVNKCTPWHHMQCVYITGSEVYKDGSAGKSTRHWWRMSYIGQACTDQYGKTFGRIFEGFFAIPHYSTMGIGNGIGYMVYLVRGSPEKIQERKRKRQQRRALRKAKRKKAKSHST